MNQDTRPCADTGTEGRDLPCHPPLRAGDAARFLKALAHDGRLTILDHLRAGEKTVTELEQLLDQRQAAVSQQLARLRSEGVVRCRRAGKARLYSIADPRIEEVMGTLQRVFRGE